MKKALRKLLSLLVIIVLVNNVFGQTTETNQLKLLSWNIYLLPGIVHTGQKKRAKGIVEVLKAGEYDIICFQEAFHKKAQRIVEEGLKEIYPYQIKASEYYKSPMKFNSGLWVVSKIPIKKIGEIKFDRAIGSDARAAKGAILFETTSGKKFRFVNTHLQSGRKGDRTAIRQSQTEQIKKQLIDPIQDNERTTFFLGDWNMGSDSDFTNQDVIDLLEVTDFDQSNIEFTWPAADYKDGDKRHFFDLILLKSIQNEVTHFECRIPNLKYNWKKGKHDLADHLPVEAVIRWE